MKKIVLIIVSLLLAGGLFGAYKAYSYKKLDSVARTIIDSIGGDAAIKKKCIEDSTGDIHMEDGKVYKRYLTMNDIMRSDKLCDCVVEKAHETLRDPELAEKTKQIATVPEARPVLLTMLTVGSVACELELYEWLNKKYKAIVIE